MLPGINAVMVGASSPGLSYTFVASGTSSTSTITIPAGAQAGDICVIVSHARNTDNTNIPSDVTPSGFTNLGGGTGTANSNGFRMSIYTKVLVSGDLGASVTVLNDNTLRNYVAVFRPSVAVATPTLVGSVSYATSNDNPVAQTVTPANGDVPYIAFGTIFCDNAGTFTTSPSGYSNINITANQHSLAYRIVNSGSASTESSDIGDTGTWNIVAAFVIKAAIL